MAISTICEHCGAGLSAPDSSLGSKVNCPTCDRKTRVLDSEGSKALLEKNERENERSEERKARLDLLTRLEKEEALRGGIESSVRNFQPRAGTRHGRLRQMGSLLLGLSWVVFLLLGLHAIFDFIQQLGLSHDGFDWGRLGGIALNVGITLIGFAILRIAAEACFFIAESGDRQWDIRALLLDLLEEQSRQGEN